MLHKDLAVVIGSSALLVGMAAVILVRPALAGRLPADHFPNIELTTHDGKKVHFYDDLIKDKIVAINLIYTHCEYSCPLETARMVQVQKILGDRVGKDIFFYSISIDPKRDTPEVLKAYMEKYHVGPGWTFLTGKKEDIDFLSKKIGLYSDPALSLDGHTPHLLIGNEPTGQWMRNSALDNPRFLSQMLGEFIDNYKNVKLAQPAAPAEAAKLNFDKAQYLFTRQCAPCHTIGNGDKIGPDLLGVTNVRNRDWLVQKLLKPDQMLAEKDPITVALNEKYKNVKMPNLRLSDEEINILIGYMVSQTSAHDREAAAKAPPTKTGGGASAPNQPR
jgi:protein SCO1